MMAHIPILLSVIGPEITGKRQPQT